METNRFVTVLLSCAALFALTPVALAVTTTWDGTTGSWSDGGKWDNGVPGAGDDAVITAGSATLSSSSAVLRSFTMGGGTLVFTNWTTKLEASNVVVNAGTMTLPGVFTEVQMSNRVWIVCTNFTLATNGTIEASQLGFAKTQGPGKGDEIYGGAGHGGPGGFGSVDRGGPAHDYLDGPLSPGSGGQQATAGGAGGGAVRIQALGTATVFGAIKANAQNATTTHGAGGSGGSVYISCKVFAGSPNGLLQANGGYGRNNGGAGAGGRIAVVYDTAAQAGLPVPGVRMQTRRGATGYRVGENGTVYLPDANFLSGTLANQIFRDTFLWVDGLTAWNLDSLSIADSSFVFGMTGLVVTVTNDILISAGGFGISDWSAIHCGGNLTLTNTSTLYAYAGATNGVPEIYGASIGVTGNLAVGANSWVYPYSQEVDGGSVLFDTGGDVTVEAGGGFDADDAGYTTTLGPGGGIHGGPYGSGGSYGGRGAPYNSGVQSSTYGHLTAPTQCGSGAGPLVWGGSGGGLIHIRATNGTVTVRGTLTANGEKGNSTHHGGGSGGGIYVQCSQFDGDNGGLLRANGANGNNGGGAGGGGRIAVVYDTTAQAGVNPGVRFETARGTVGPSYGLKTSENGTLYLPDASFLSSTLDNDQFDDVYLTLGNNFTSWVLDNLTINVADLTIANSNLTITVSNTVALGDEADFGIMNGSSLVCSNLTTAHDVIGGGSSILRLFAGPTNGIGADYSTLLQVNGTMTLVTNAWVYPYSEHYNGGSPLFRINDLVIQNSGGFDANGLGYWTSQGPGAGGATWGGGGYGGKGGAYSGAEAGPTYGSETTPADPGSGGREYAGGSGSGGGFIRIESGGTITLDGVLKADGLGGGTTHANSGSGGGIFVKRRTFAGSATGQLLASGGDGRNNGAGGGGGRIAVWRFEDTSSGTVTATVNPGDGLRDLPDARGANTGTLFWVISAPAITNHPAVDIGFTQGSMVGELTATGFSPTVVQCYWGESDEGEQPGTWDHTNSFGVQAPGMITNTILTLTAGTVYHYRFYATNDAGEAWASPAESFSTLGGGVTVDNSTGAASITPTSATLWGEVTAGNPAPTSFVCWGESDAGDVATSNWDHVSNRGEHLGLFSLPVSGLLANKTYFYRCYAVNTNADDWANSTANFTTAGPYISVQDAEVTEGNAGTVAMNFTVTLSATSIVDVSVDYGTSNGTADAGTDYLATNGTLVIPSNQLSGTVTVLVVGDTEDEFPSQSVFVNLSGAVSGTITGGAGEGTITDDDAVPETNTWNGTADWTTVGNWSQARLPRDIDYAVIASGNVSLSAPQTVRQLNVTSGAVMTFTNGNSTLTASNVVVEGGGLVTTPSDITIIDPINRVLFACTNLTVATNGLIDVSAKGYVAAQGPGAGSGATFGSGAGHGGAGGEAEGATAGGGTYGSLTAPETPGSGGADPAGGGSGGGVIRIDALGTVTVFGTIAANGESTAASYDGGGSGGSVLVNCRTLAGSTAGLIQANGGGGNSRGGRGGGGRIAVIYDEAAQAVVPDPGVRMQTRVGTTGYRTLGDDGTLYLPNTEFLSTDMKDQLFRDVVLHIPGFTNWSVSSLSVRDCSFAFGEEGFDLTVATDLEIDNGYLGLGPHSQATVGGDLTLTNGGALKLYAGATNGVAPAYGGLLDVGGHMRVENGCWVYPWSDETNGGSILVRCGDLTVAAGGGFDAYMRGFKDKFGPGAEPAGNWSGGGYGGRGSAGGAMTTPPPTYGAVDAPALPGSGGGYLSIGGNGGGLIWIDAPSGTVTVHGTLTANGENMHGTHGGGGSGGAVFITCRRFEGSSSGLLQANGANGSNQGGGGGGGRIAVVYDTVVQAGYSPGVRMRASRGALGYNGGFAKIGHHGTVYLSDASFLSGSLTAGVFQDVTVFIPGFTNWSLPTLTVDNASLAFGDPGLTITVTGKVSVANGGDLGLPANGELTCGELDIAGASLTVQGGATNGVPGDYGALVHVLGDATVGAGGWVYPVSDPATGGSPLFRVRNLTVAGGGGFNADARGYPLLQGPGAGSPAYGGGGYGGKGGNGSSGAGGAAYGSSNAPAQPGSGGNYAPTGGSAGGLIRIEAKKEAAVAGTLTANGETAWSTHGAGGSGGGILLSCGTFSNAVTTVLRANGGNGNNAGGGAGGGRIAVWQGGVRPADQDKILAGRIDQVQALSLTVSDTDPAYLGAISVTNGTGYYNAPDSRASEAGTTLFLAIEYPPLGSIITVR